MMMRMLLVTCIMGLAILNRVCEGLLCHECLDIEYSSSSSIIRDYLASKDVSDPSCKQQGENVNIKTVHCQWKNGVPKRSNLTRLHDNKVDDGTIWDERILGYDNVVCKNERSKLTAYFSGETITVHIWSRGCQAVPSSTPLSCTNDVENNEHAIISYVDDGMRKELGYSPLTSTSGTLCLCDTDNCNSASPLIAPPRSRTTPASPLAAPTPSPTKPPCTRNCNSASLLTAPAWIAVLPLLAIAAAFLNKG